MDLFLILFIMIFSRIIYLQCINILLIINVYKISILVKKKKKFNLSVQYKRVTKQISLKYSILFNLWNSLP